MHNPTKIMPNISLRLHGHHDAREFTLLRFLNQRPSTNTTKDDIQKGVLRHWTISRDENLARKAFAKAFSQAQQRGHIDAQKGPGGGFFLTSGGRAAFGRALASRSYADSRELEERYRQTVWPVGPADDLALAA